MVAAIKQFAGPVEQAVADAVDASDAVKEWFVRCQTQTMKICSYSLYFKGISRILYFGKGLEWIDSIMSQILVSDLVCSFCSIPICTCGIRRIDESNKVLPLQSRTKHQI